MAKAWLLLLSGLSLVACQRGCHHADPAKGIVAEPGVGPDSDAQPRVGFLIDTVYEHQRPTERAPWRTAGGDWTFFDAHTEAGARFSFGWKQGALKNSMAFGEALWSVSDPNQGADLIGRFARAFDGKVPPPMPQQPLHPEPFSLAVLGDALGRGDAGGFSGVGNWHATKLFLQRPGIEAEVFFNFDLVDKRGEFAEKDSEYANDLLLFMARELRDGPLPPQTPENDARISLVGPKLADFRPLGPPGAIFRAFEANGARVVYSVKDGAGTKVMSVASDGPPQEQELVRLEHEFSGMACTVSEDTCLVEETQHKDPNSFSGSDPRDFVLLRRAQKQNVPLTGPWGTQGSTTEATFSLDGKFAALSATVKKSKATGYYRVLHFVSIDAPANITTYAHGEDWLDVVGWQGSGAELRALAQIGLRYDKNEKKSWLLVDPKSGAATELLQAPDALTKNALSPDGKHRYSCNKDEEVVITDVATRAARSFPVALRERHALADGCELSWRGPRFLEFSPERPAFIDIDSLKLSFPFAVGAEPQAPNCDASFSWAVVSKESQLSIARVVVR